MRDSASDRQTVLIVEDDAATCDAITTLLTDEGYQVMRTASSAVGARLARQYQPAAVVLDSLVDPGSSLTLLEAIRGNLATRDLHTVVLLASAHPSERAQFQGADVVLVQPLVSADLLAALQPRRRLRSTAEQLQLRSALA